MLTAAEPAANATVSDKKLLVAIMRLSSRGVDTNAAHIVEDAIGNQIVQDGRFRLMERAQMDQILKEQGFQQSGACEKGDCAVEVGKLLGVDRSVVGSLGLLGRTYVLNARLVNVGTGEVMGTSQRTLSGEIDNVLSDLVPKVVADLQGVAIKKVETAPISTTTVPAQAASVPPKPKEKGGPSDNSSGSGHTWVWMTAGGVVVAGGVAAALLLMKSPSNSQTPVVDDGGSNQSKNGNLEVVLQ